ncbi:hypothetical protein BAUCODRAFT_415292 [Baudoinia panamericana UAMH 10762]|uniref:Uncharacterized protein n=1 Tax=Baudoinia panamericana (strain UAMH 10762) TaxID=717646 RepID=M2NGQ0_BAUPA|nr:uncharacterized protein BAUCODRAFT_415292 [Baudoinia panamericana UAMH 10762]EMC98180.1 hypothetical protein BAUCODRAFT_415292 [Baudoinia panamericana UAMH 10762]
MSSYLPSAPQLRRLTHTTDVPYHPATVFAALTDVPSYPSVLDLISTSTLTAKDASGLPKSAKLKVGYPSLGIAEEWPCLLSCSRNNGVVEVRSKNGDAGAEGSIIFATWLQRWKIQPPPTTAGSTGVAGKKTARLTLEMEVKFKSIVYDQMFALVAEGTAAKFVSKFEPRFAEVDEKERKEGVEKLREKAKAEAAKKVVTTKDSVPAKSTPKKLEVRSAAKTATASKPAGKPAA